MRFFRSQRVSSLICEELSKILEREMEFPGALVTITEVEVEKKLESARVMVSVIPSERGSDALLALGKEAGHLQHLLNRKMNIKPMPRIIFELDHGIENAAQVEKRLLEEEEKK